MERTVQLVKACVRDDPRPIYALLGTGKASFVSGYGKNKWNLFHFVAKHNSVLCFKALVKVFEVFPVYEYVDASVKTFEGIKTKKKKVFPSMISFLLQCDANSRTLLHLAAWAGSSSIVSSLIRILSENRVLTKEFIIKQDKNGWTVFYIACRFCHPKIALFFLQTQHDIISSCLFTLINERTITGDTSLLTCIRTSSIKMAKLLSMHKFTNFDVEDGMGCNCLTLCVDIGDEDLFVFVLKAALLKLGAKKTYEFFVKTCGVYEKSLDQDLKNQALFLIFSSPGFKK